MDNMEIEFLNGYYPSDMEKHYRMLHIYKYDNFMSFLNEGLIKTYSLEKSKQLIRSFFSKKIGYGIKTDSDKKTGTIFIKGQSNIIYNKDIKGLIRVIVLCGYFPSTIEFYNKDDNFIDTISFSNDFDQFTNKLNENLLESFYFQITIESKFNKIIKNVPDKLYHISRISNVVKITKFGMNPRSKNKKAYHPDRVYLGYDANNVSNIANQFGKGEYVLYEIDMTKIGSNNTPLINYIKLYDDPDFSGYGCYTHENIPPNCIKPILKIKISDENK